MAESFESQSWYRAAHLKPKLSDRVEISRQVFRGATWFVLRDPVSGKFSRISESAYILVALMDGARPLGDIWDIACTELGDDAPPQDELLAIVSQLNTLDLLRTDGLPDASSLALKGTRMRARGLLSRFLNPLAVRFPLFDPDALITRLWPLARPFFSVLGAIGYCVLLVSGAFSAARHWEQLTENLVDRAMAADSLLILVLIYPFVKAFHELAHGLAVKKWGGEVRDIGLMFLVFIPVPYVDASAASGFPNKWARILVGAIGILIELGLAAAAMLIWTELEEGIWRAVCFNVMLIGGISTLLFNGNPLLRFDGYFVLSDLIEIPNLGPRSNRYVGYIVQRFLFGLRGVQSPARSRGERKWLFSYSILAFFYRLFIMFAIITLVATKFFALGILLAFWSFTLMVFVPIYKNLRFLFFSENLKGHRKRAWLASGVIVATVLGAVLFVPIPYRTVAEGIVRVPDHATVYAGEAGQVSEVLVSPNGFVDRAAPIVRLVDPFADAELEVARADARIFALRHQQALGSNAFDVRLWRAQAARAQAQVRLLEERQAGLIVRSPKPGRLVLPGHMDLPGKYLNKGDVVGYVVDPRELVIRTAVSQDDADLIRRRTFAVSLRPVEEINIIVDGKIVGEVPTVGGELASFALSTEGGGQFVLDPRSEGVPRTLEHVMHFDIAFLGLPPTTVLNTRVFVRFDHGFQPLAARIWRGFRQLFLRRFNV